jgi:SOS response regulatory protein OraA/RecX
MIPDGKISDLKPMDEIYAYALKLLRARDYTVARLRLKLETRFGEVPQAVFDLLLQKNFLNDRRFAENHVNRRRDRGAAVLREELLARGISLALVDETVSGAGWPSLREALTAKMNVWKLRAPVQSRDAARLFRALHRLGYEEDAIREEIEQLHEQ